MKAVGSYLSLSYFSRESGSETFAVKNRVSSLWGAKLFGVKATAESNALYLLVPTSLLIIAFNRIQYDTEHFTIHLQYIYSKGMHRVPADADCSWSPPPLVYPPLPTQISCVLATLCLV